MKKRSIIAWVFLAAWTWSLFSCGTRPSPKTLTLMTYNVGAFSKYVDNSTAGVARLILDNGVQLAALNELDSCNRRHNSFQLKDLAAELGDWQYLFSSAFPYAGGAYGNGVVSSAPIEKRYRIALPRGDGSEPRSVAVAETADCVFASVHLDHKSQAAALEQMKTVNDWFGKVYAGSKKPVFLCGDFNVVPEDEVIALAKTQWTLLSGTAFTHSTHHPKHCIDYIFALQDAAPVEVLDVRVLTEGTEEMSDHFPILMNVKF